MVAQISSSNSQTQILLPMLKTDLIDPEAYSREEVIELVVKLFGYGKHLGLSSDTYNNSDKNRTNLLVRKGVKRDSRWIKIELVNVEKLQKNKLETKMVFYAEKQFDEDWFVSYFHSGKWMDELKAVVDEFEGRCFCSI